MTGSSPCFKIHRKSAESTQKGGMGRFDVAATCARREACLDSFRVAVGLWEDNRRVSSRPALGTLGMHHTLWMRSWGCIRERNGRATRIETLDFDDEIGTIEARCNHLWSSIEIVCVGRSTLQRSSFYDPMVKGVTPLKKKDRD
ncbi:hypothetical protein PIB30_089320 [Stylosanthes scabra]|uniref:Uncharacterized protein n=1 Tax=Stylosanthes scabra TaxID=79078 RepID=A0ABU6QTD8_9FABA|nr:hypothetical protein [Stylosanthes scabra]